MKHCSRPCAECPYRKDSTPGYFGGNDPAEYQVAMHRDTVVACHIHSKYDFNGDLVTPVVCRGHLLAQRKVCKRTQHEDAAAIVATEEFQQQYEAMMDDILGFDFAEYHKIGLEDDG